MSHLLPVHPLCSKTNDWKFPKSCPLGCHMYALLSTQSFLPTPELNTELTHTASSRKPSPLSLQPQVP